MTYLHSGGTENQTIHDLIFPINVTAQVLIVAGGGGGGARQGYNSGGGGGAGEVLETIISFDKNTSYTIKIGRGGNSSGTETSPAEEGFDSGIFLNSNVVKHCKGGGRGGFGKRVSSYTWNATDGGSGGGASRGNNNTQGVSIKYNIDGHGNDGRNAHQEAGGGGGAGGIGTGSEKNPGSGYYSRITGTETVYASGGVGGWQYSQDYSDSGYGSGGGGRAATTNDTSIAIGESGNSGIIIIKCL